MHIIENLLYTSAILTVPETRESIKSDIIKYQLVICIMYICYISVGNVCCFSCLIFKSVENKHLYIFKL